MSASLVGSEMCIRDRHELEQRRLLRRKVPERLDARVLELRCPAPRAEPVSYTHLTLPTICSV
eukprot:9394235-Alexandrium_andersonii.AAC.1